MGGWNFIIACFWKTRHGLFSISFVFIKIFEEQILLLEHAVPSPLPLIIRHKRVSLLDWPEAFFVLIQKKEKKLFLLG